MSKTQFLIGGNGLNFQDNFYPQDLPKEWRFDYYSASFEALCLPIDTAENLPAILTEFCSDADEFELVLSINKTQLADTQQLSALLALVADYQAFFTLYCQTNTEPKAAAAALLANYKLCFQSDQKLQLDLNQAFVNQQYFAFNHYPIFIANSADLPQTKTYLAQTAKIQRKSIVIFNTKTADYLAQTRVISELLGF